MNGKNSRKKKNRKIETKCLPKEGAFIIAVCDISGAGTLVRCFVSPQLDTRTGDSYYPIEP